MTQPSQVPAVSGKRLCGICNKPLANYNKDDICMSHNAADVAKYRERVEKQSKESRAIQSFIKEFHKESTVKEMFVAADQASEPSKRMARTELEQYPEALGVLRVGSLIFRLTMPSILQKNPTDSGLAAKRKFVRDVLTYIMRRDLKMTPEAIATFFGYRYLPRVAEGVERIQHGLLDDEEIILAVDLVREERALRLAREETI